LAYPVQMDQFQELEQHIGIPFNVFTLCDHEGRARYPLYSGENYPNTGVDLPFWDGHFAWIKSVSRFLGACAGMDIRMLWSGSCSFSKRIVLLVCIVPVRCVFE
jgi:hypothetical protein